MTAPVLQRKVHGGWALWAVGAACYAAIFWYPISSRATRLGAVVLLGLLWAGLLALAWRRPVWRSLLVTLTLAAGGFLLWPSTRLPSVETRRSDYTGALRRYAGVRYVWGGENRRGIDCSGLIRRGLIDSLLWRGVTSWHPALVRQGLVLWWNDTTAAALGEAGEQTVRVRETESINELGAGQIEPGDLAVTRNGVHILASLGGAEWIEADPVAGRVLEVTAPSTENPWLATPVKIVRWRLLAGEIGDPAGPPKTLAVP